MTPNPQSVPSSPEPARHLGAEAAAGLASTEKTRGAEGKKTLTKPLSPDSLKAYEALYEGVPAVSSPAKDPLVDQAPGPIKISSSEVQSPGQAMTLFKLIAEMGDVFKAQGQEMMGVNKELGNISGQIDKMLQKMTSFSKAMAATNAQIKADNPLWVRILEGIVFAIIGVAVGAAIGGPVAAIAAAVVGIGNTIMNDVTIKGKDGKEESLWDAVLGGLPAKDQFWVKMGISLFAGVATGLGVGALSSFATALETTVEDTAENVGEEAGAIEMDTIVPEGGEVEGEGGLDEIGEQEEDIEEIDKQKEAKGEEAAKEKTQSAKERAIQWVNDSPTAKSIVKAGAFGEKGMRRAVIQGIAVFGQEAGELKSKVDSDPTGGEFGLFADAAVWAQGKKANSWAGYLDYIATGIQFGASIVGGLDAIKNPASIGGLMQRIFQAVPLVSAVLEGGASIATSVTQFEVAGLYDTLAATAEKMDMANKHTQAFEWNQQILNGMMKQVIKENAGTMRTINGVLETVEVGLSSQGQQRA